MSDRISLEAGSKTPRIMVIAGGSGLLGSHLAKYYHNHGFQVRIADIKPPPQYGTRRYYSESLLGNLCDLEFCKYVVRGAEVVLHCATVDVKGGANDSYIGDAATITYQRNHLMTQNLLTSACHAGVLSFFYASATPSPRSQSTSATPQYDDSTTRLGPTPQSLFELEKLHSEQLVLYYSSQMAVRIARFANIYGPHTAFDDDNNSPVTLIRRVLAAKHLIGLGMHPTIELLGDLKCERQFTYVDDAVKAVVSLMEKTGTEPQPTIHPNLPITIVELAKLTLDVVGLDRSSVDITNGDSTIDIGDSDLTPSLPPSSPSDPLASYRLGLSNMRDWMEPKIQATMSGRSPEECHNYLMSLLSSASVNRAKDNPVKCAILLPISSQTDLDSTLEHLTTFARSLRDTSWRDRNELGATQYQLSIYLAIDIGDAPLFPLSPRSESRAELIFRENGCSRVFIVPCHFKKGAPGLFLNNAARRAYADRCDYYVIMKPGAEMLDEGWMRHIHCKFSGILADSGGPIGFGCASFADSMCPGIPTFPVVHRTHLDIFEGEMVPNELDSWDTGVYLFQLYRHFGASTPILSRIRGLYLATNINPRDSPNWTFDMFEGKKTRIRLWAEQNSLNIQSKVSLDIIIPSYRLSLGRLSKIIDLKPSPSCITTFIIVVDNPQSPYAYELKHSNRHRTDVRILVNESNRGASSSRNTGLATSTAEWVAFLDDDVDPAPNYLIAAEHYIRNQPDAAGFVGNTYFPMPHSIFTTAIRLSGVTSFWDIADKITEDVPWGITANLIVRRNVCDQVKFDLRFPKTGGGEDIDFCINKRKASLERGDSGFWAAPKVVVAHPWWNGGRRSYRRFFNWSRGDGALIKMHTDLSWRDVTPNSAEYFLISVLSMVMGIILLNWSIIRFGIILAVSTFSAHVLHDAHRHLVRQKTEVGTIQAPLGPIGWAVAISEGALIRMVNDVGRLVGILERYEWRSVRKRFDWFTGGPMGIIDERSGGIERGVLILCLCIVLLNIA